MHEHNHSAKREPPVKPTDDEIAKKAYAIYVNEGRPQGHARQNWSEAEALLQQSDSDRPDHPTMRSGMTITTILPTWRRIFGNDFGSRWSWRCRFSSSRRCCTRWWDCGHRFISLATSMSCSGFPRRSFICGRAAAKGN